LTSGDVLRGGLGRLHVSEHANANLGVGGHGSEFTDSWSESFAERLRLAFFPRCTHIIVAHTKEQMAPNEIPTPIPTCTAKLIRPSPPFPGGLAGSIAVVVGVVRIGGTVGVPRDTSRLA